MNGYECVTWVDIDPPVRVWLYLWRVWPSRHVVTGRLPLYIQHDGVDVRDPVVAQLYRAAVTCEDARIVWVRDVVVRTRSSGAPAVWPGESLIVPLEAVEPHEDNLDYAHEFDDLFTQWAVDPLPRRH